MKTPRITNPIRGFAVICVAVIAAFIMWMAYRLTEVLASPTWCASALQAEKISPGNTFVGLTSCVSLLTIQLKSIATANHIAFGVLALCLLTLIVIVVAGGKLSFAASRSGVSANMGKGDVAAVAADQVAGAAEAKADEIKKTGFTAPPGEEL